MARMSATRKVHFTELLPDPLPANPFAVLDAWLERAVDDAVRPNPNAMVLATVDAQGQPSARVVLCKGIDAAAGAVFFYTNYDSRKGRELAANPRVAAVFHWDYLHRQVRIEGRVERLSDAENDVYFRTRPWQSRLGAWASRQSQPLESRERLGQEVAAAARRFGIPYAGPGAPEPEDVEADVPRPPHWGGFRLHADAIELWVEGEFRVHDRARFSRPSLAGAPWPAVRLQP